MDSTGYAKLEKNLIDILKEQQMKLGYCDEEDCIIRCHRSTISLERTIALRQCLTDYSRKTSLMSLGKSLELWR